MNLNERIFAALNEKSQSVHNLMLNGFGTGSTIRKALTRLKREGKVAIVDRVAYFGNRKENVWGVANQVAA